MRCLLASDHSERGQQCRLVMLRGGLECPPAHVVSLELASERASRIAPEFAVVAMSGDVERAMQTIRELSAILRTNVVVVGPANDPKLILRALSEGANEFLDENLVDQELAEAIIRSKGRLAADAETAAAPGRIISILAPSGGSGASTLAANLSAALARQHGSCGLVDLRSQAGDLAALLDLKPNYTVADICENLTRIDRTMFDRFFVEHASGIHLLAAPYGREQAEMITAKGVRQMLSMGRCRFPYMVVDLERNFNDAQVEALWQSETIVLVLRLDYTSLRNVRRLIEQLQEMGIDAERLRLVVNRYGERQQLSVAAAEQALGMKIASFIPNDPWRINRAINSGTPVVLQRPSAKVSRRIAQLAVSVNGHHHAGPRK